MVRKIVIPCLEKSGYFATKDLCLLVKLICHCCCCWWWFTGPKPALLDFVLWPWFERFYALTYINQDLKLPADRFPRLIAWQSAMCRLPAVKSCAIDTQSHAVYLQSTADKQPNYGYGLEW